MLWSLLNNIHNIYIYIYVYIYILYIFLRDHIILYIIYIYNIILYLFNIILLKIIMWYQSASSASTDGTGGYSLGFHLRALVLASARAPIASMLIHLSSVYLWLKSLNFIRHQYIYIFFFRRPHLYFKRTIYIYIYIYI